VRAWALLRSLRCTALALLSALALPGGAVAEALPLWELGAGVGALRLPHYRGSDQDHTWLLPVPYFVYRGDILKADREGARAVLFDSERVEFDLSLAASAPTRSEDDDARRGMDDLAPTLELGPNVNWTLARGAGWKLDLRAPVRAALTLESRPRMIGWTATPNLNLDVTRLGGWNLGLQAGPVWGSRRFHDHFYGVPRGDATADRPAFEARSGWGGAQATAALSRRFGPLWTGAFLRYDSVRGAAFEDSPLVRRRENLSFGIALSWVFARSGRLVQVDDPLP
jgi:outer membrane scaffolding protein for murein synthesis (MipA/OmpV family)